MTTPANMTRKLLLTLFILVVGSSAAFGQSRKEIGPYEYDRITVLHLSGQNTVQIEVGKSHQFELLSSDPIRAGVFYKVQAPVTWSVAKAKGIKLDENTGLLTTKASVKHGTMFTVTATVDLTRPYEHEKRHPWTVQQQVIVYDPAANPLVGSWKEMSAASCDDPTRIVEGDPIKELEFRADGTFSVVWDPFEVYKDYWGTYSFDRKSGNIALKVVNGNAVPALPDLDGTAKVEGTKLVLDQLSLGKQNANDAICRMEFERY